VNDYSPNAAATKFADYLLKENIQDAEVRVDPDDDSFVAVDFSFEDEPLAVVFYANKNVSFYSEVEGVIGEAEVEDELAAVVAAMDFIDL
jgi:alkyl sulfatase BDS1-like metallo-beta-lactamase superfamily hydrolase